MAETILVVGGAGYIGSHMVKALQAAGYEVVVIDNLSTGHRDLVGDVRFFEGDMQNQDLLDTVFAQTSISAVMHFAAFSLVGESVDDPIKYYRNNVAATTELIGAMLRYGVRRFIFSSTAAVYGEPDQTPIPEIHPCRPTNPYGATKVAVERLLHDCGQAHGLRSAVLRYFNAAGADASAQIGERHRPESHLIPLVLQVATGERDAIRIFGTDYPTVDGTCVRDYVHVADLAQAHLLTLEALLDGAESMTYNLGNSRGSSVLEVVEAVRRVTGHPIPAVVEGRRSGDPAVLVADSTRIRQELGWKPHYEELEQIVETAWRWHQLEAAEI